ncbi:hypothetical protein [Rhodococcoides fascians]|uniref:hypothetical protein n=1 Tax=Rhodococcoides fascians TaxID=1828 RepID=UPI00050CE50C|nr:hypothetical protein [Rhodococcus fascians]
MSGHWDWTQEPDDDQTFTGKIRQRIIDAYEYNRNPVGFWRRLGVGAYVILGLSSLLNLVVLDVGDLAINLVVIAALVWLDSSAYRSDQAKQPV